MANWTCGNCTAHFEPQYSTHVYTKRVEQLIYDWRPGLAPLFIYVAWQAVHEPLELPPSTAELSDLTGNASPGSTVATILDRSRRVYNGMLAVLDEGIGNISAALREASLANDTVLVLSNDNGGMSGTYGMACCQCGTSCGGLNYPYRGWKDSFWEGGFRGIGLVHSPLLLPHMVGTSYVQLLWVGDWFRTLLSAALSRDSASRRSAAWVALRPLLGIGPIDSVDHWAALGRIRDAEEAPAHGREPQPPRSELVLAGLDSDRRAAAIRVGRYKLLLGAWGDDRWCDLNVSEASPAYPAPSNADGLGGEGGLWCMHLPKEQGEPRPAARYKRPRAPTEWFGLPTRGLYDVVADPREMHDIQHTHPQVVAMLAARLAYWNRTTAQSAHRPNDPMGAAHATTTHCWGPWRDGTWQT